MRGVEAEAGARGARAAGPGGAAGARGPRADATGGWRAAAARCVGSAHVAAGLPCQDRALALVHADGTAVAALADGAGSAALSHEGAELVVRRAADIACERFDEVFRRNIAPARFGAWMARGLQWELSQHAGAHDGACQLRDLASTLLLVCVRDGRYLALHLGDGIIGAQVRTASGRLALRTLSTPSNGEFANETVFTTSAAAPAALRVYRGPLAAPGGTSQLVGFILMSDGPEASLYHKPSRTLAGATGKLLGYVRGNSPQKAEALLHAALKERIATRTQDDCSLALLAR